MIRDAPDVPVADRAAWRRWLEANAATSDGVWVVHTKGPRRTVTYDDIVEEAICFGWVDSTVRSVDETRSALYVAPRRARSSWSRSNQERVARLEAAGLMTDLGRAAVADAKARGAWPEFEPAEAPTDRGRRR